MENLNIQLAGLQNEILEFRGIPKYETIRSLEVDSRKIRPGDWFICLKGETHDGHDFIEQAISAGATGIIFDKDISVESGIRVADTTAFLGVLAASHKQIIQPFVIAVTGSNGKTSTKEILAFLLNEIYPGEVCYSSGNYNNQFGVPFTLLSLRSHHRYLIVELGSNHPGEIQYLSKLCTPDMALITSVSLGHVGNFGSTQNILEEKSDIMAGMKRDGKIFMHDDLGREKLILAKAEKSGVAIKKLTDAIFPQEYDDGGCHFTFCNKTYYLPVAGKHQFENLLLVVTLIRELSQDDHKLESALTRLSEYRPVKGRLQRIMHNDFQLWDDSYNANPGSFEKAIDFISANSRAGQYFGAFGMMGELGNFSGVAHRKLGEIAAKAGFSGVFFSANDEAILAAFREGWMQIASKDILFLAENADRDIQAGFEFLSKRMAKGDHLLIKGSRSTRMERILEYFNRNKD